MGLKDHNSDTWYGNFSNCDMRYRRIPIRYIGNCEISMQYAYAWSPNFDLGLERTEIPKYDIGLSIILKFSTEYLIFNLSI